MARSAMLRTATAARRMWKARRGLAEFIVGLLLKLPELDDLESLQLVLEAVLLYEIDCLFNLLLETVDLLSYAEDSVREIKTVMLSPGIRIP